MMHQVTTCITAYANLSMTAMMNGIALHGGLIAYGATFLMFMEYARNALRMAALMKIQNIQVYTHDSIGLGEDGPTQSTCRANFFITLNAKHEHMSTM